MASISKYLCFIFLLQINASAGAQFLSDKAEISVLSFGPGNEVYSIWGHTAIRVNDPMHRIDKVYNYGTFDFDTPNFAITFLRGKLDYALSAQSYRRVIASYEYEKRSVYEQVLNLSSAEKNELYSLLEENYKKENRYYRYDFFFDNCATRPLQIIEKSLDDNVAFKEKYADKTFRDILKEHLIQTPWLDFGIDLIVGAEADKTANPRQQMFMPIYIRDYFSDAGFVDVPNKKLVKRSLTIIAFPTDYPTTLFSFFTPVVVFSLLLLLDILLLYLSIKQKKMRFVRYDTLWFGVITLASLFFLFMWFGTDHQATKENWNLLWANPIFIFLLLPFAKNQKKWIAQIIFIVLVLCLLLSMQIPQQFHPAVIPIIVILSVKTYKYGFGIKKVV